MFLKKIITDFDPLCSNDVIYRWKISIRFCEGRKIVNFDNP